MEDQRDSVFNLKQQLLLQQYEAQRKELLKANEVQIAEIHQAQRQLLMAQEVNFIEQQQKLAEEKRRLELENQKIERIKHKEKHEQSAVASDEVKQRLQEFVLSKRQREISHSQSTLRNWNSESGQEGTPQHMGMSPPYKHPLLSRYDVDFPLRKTSSEPNLKVRSILKHKVIERRSSPLLPRRKGMMPTKRKAPLSLEADGTFSQDSEPSSPVTNNDVRISPNSVGSTDGMFPEGYMGRLPLEMMKSIGVKQTQINDALYASPSLPNISLGRPHNSSSPSVSSEESEAEVRAMGTARYGMPLTSHVLPEGWPYYPSSMPIIEGESTPPTSPATYSQLSPPLVMTAEAHLTRQARLHRSGLKPLSRTHSAPLPLQHPLLQQQQDMLLHQQEQYLLEKAYYDQQQQMKRQQIRQAILTRCNAKKQVENVEEETEASMRKERQNDTIQEEVETMNVDKVESNVESGVAFQKWDISNFVYEPRLGPPIPKPVTRAFSSPLAAFNVPIQEAPPSYKFTTGLTYDSLMLKHQCMCGNYSNHPEHGGRLQSIWARLQETGLAGRCERVHARKATLEEIQTCHTEAHALFFGTSPLNRQKIDPHKLAKLPIKNFVIMPCTGLGVDSDTSWNELHTGAAARMAAGCAIELAMKVGAGEIKNGFAIVRPPGHHAEIQQAMGFCFFNNIVIAAKLVQKQLKLDKVLILDWDIHHGNGTQQMTYTDPHILYLSLHRHDNGNFFPGTGAPQEVGEDDGIGFNVNIAFSGSLNPPMSDSEYLAAFRTMVMPIAREFDPDIVLVSAGFDATAGHPPQLGGYEVSPALYGHLTKEIMTLAKGKVVLVLEGGYNLPTICDASEECVKALLGDSLSPIRESELNRPPNQPCQETLEKVFAIQAPHWPSIKRRAGTIGYTYHQAEVLEKEEAETVSAFASLSMVQAANHSPMIRNGALDVMMQCTIQEKPMEEDEVQIISTVPSM